MLAGRSADRGHVQHDAWRRDRWDARRVCSSDAKLKRLKELGAAEVINYKTTPEWDQRVLELTGGLGVAHVVEIGGPGTLPRSINAVKTGGTVSLIGILGGAGQIDPMTLLFKSARIQGILVG
jgi:NADPH:quinone reductase-like Zn-dependent oxidoreductase